MFRPMTCALTASISLGLMFNAALRAEDAFGNGTVITPSTASGGTGTVADLQSDNDTRYSVIKSATVNISGFGSHTGAINKVYLFAQYSVEPGYSGTNALQVNGVNTTIIPADRGYGRWGYTEITAGAFGIDTSAEIESMVVSFFNNDGGASNAVLFDCVYVVVNPTSPIPIHPTWLEDFNGSGEANPMVWTYEVGYQRNNELQYYQAGATNGWQEGGNFVIEGRKESVGGYAYTSASIVTSGKYHWHYGRAQIRAQIPAKAGMWPAIWGTGDNGEWPYNGEVDILEYYQNKILANCAVGNGTRWTAKWDSSNRSMTSLTAVDPNWKTQWHIWTMQWDDQNVRLYCDNILMNTIPQTWLRNSNGASSWGPEYPFISNGMSCWLNLAMGGAGGDPSATMNAGPERYLIDYWKVWEGATANTAPSAVTIDTPGVNEGQPAGTLVGYLTATDPDPAEVIRYELVTDSSYPDNSKFVIPEFLSDNTLRGALMTAEPLNYDDGATRTILVRATDIMGVSCLQELTINVLPSQVILVTPSQIAVPEGGTNSFDVKLRVAPASDITVNVSRSSGDTDLSVSAGATLTFTPLNGSEWQTVTIAAAEDADILHGSAVFSCVDGSGVFSAEAVNVSEVENDNGSPVVEAGPSQTALLIGTAAGDPTPGADIFLDAGQDDETDSTWTDTLGTWSPTIKGTGLAYITNAGSSRSGITAAYDFPGATNDGGFEGTSLQDMALDQLPISLEIWFKPDVSASYPANGQVLWETGGGTGLGIFYRDGFVEVAHDSNKDRLSTNVSALTADFIQVVVTYDPTSSSNNYSFYVNGENTTTISRSDPDMCASDPAGLGRQGGSNTGGAGTGAANTESFNGQIAIFRAYHNQILTPTEVTANYDSIVGATVTVNLDGTVTDPNSESTTVLWTIVSGPAAVSFGDANAVDTTATFGAVGTYVLRLTADDGTSVPGYDEVTITVSSSNAYATWATGTFANAFVDTGASLNPDGDAFTNLQEFAFGTDPTVSDTMPLSYTLNGDVTRTGMPLLQNFAAQGEAPDYRAVFLRRKDHVTAGIIYSVDFSAELGQWTTSGDSPTVLTGAGSSGDYEAVSVPFPATVPANGDSENLPPHFFRVGVQSN